MSTVSYRRLFNLGNYENESIGFDLPIEPDESEADALARVKALVMELAGKSGEYKKLEDRRQKAEYELYGLESKIAAANHQLAEAVAKHDHLRAVLATHGVAIESLDEWYRLDAAAPQPESDPEPEDEDEGDYEYEEEE